MTTTTQVPKLTDKLCAALYVVADTQGKEAADTVIPQPMLVVQTDVATGAVLRRYPPVMDGVCGFAWVVVRPGGSSFARWLKKNKGAGPAYGGGTQVWISDYNQSMTRKFAYAEVFAAVLREHGINASAESRMD